MIPEFYRPVETVKITDNGIEMRIEANEEERAALAKRLNLLELGKFSATLQLIPADDTVAAHGRIEAEAVQQCIVTLEPIPVKVIETISGLFAPEGVQDEEEDGEGLEDEIDPIIKGVLDLGEFATQHLALALPPYPRKPGAELTPQAPAAATTRPLAQLKDLLASKQKNGKNE